MTIPTTRLAEIAERHSKTTPGEWSRSGIVHKREGIRHFTVLAADLVLFEISAGRLDQYYNQSRADADFIAHSHQDVPWMHAQLTAAQERERMDAEIMRAGAAALSWAAIQSDPNLTKQICALCHSWVWDDSEENIKPIQHKPDCLVTKLRDRADQLEGRTDG